MRVKAALSVFATVALLLASATVSAAASFFDVLPAADPDPGVPTARRVLGYEWGERISDPDQLLTYARALAAGAPSRVRLVEYATSLEGRPLVLLLVSAPDNLAKLDGIRDALGRLGDPRVTNPTQASEIEKTLPAVVWVACSVHGDETSGGDAGLALAYYLASARAPEIQTILEHTVVIVDPMQNPDGRARFVDSTRAARGVVPDPSPASAEHIQPWPGGRVSHELFDLNRDWFALTHPETRGRVTAMLRWHPQVVMDLHEMGADMGYYFAPPAAPYNPLLSKDQMALWQLLGKANGAAFDARGWRYWTREQFDAFYPGYGESWPYFSGAVGMTFEQASSRGLVTRLEDGSLLTYTDAVQHHLVAAFFSCRTVADHRARFLEAWRAYRESAVDEARKGAVRAWVLEPGDAPLRASALASLLVRQGIEVRRVTADGGGIAAGSYVVPMDQPLGRLAQTLLQPDFSMGKAFEEEQERRDAKRLGEQIYDITAWSLPLLWEVPARTVAALPAGLATAPVTAAGVPAGAVAAGHGAVAFLLPWDSVAAVRATATLLRGGVKLYAAGKAFTIGGRHYHRGTVVIRRAGNGEDLPTKLEQVARETGVTFYGTDTSYAEEGVDLGSSNVRYLKAPRVALLWDVPTSPTAAGAERYAMEFEFNYPVTVVRTSSLGRADLSDFDVIVLPDGSRRSSGYAQALGKRGAERLASWVDQGGVLVGIGAGAAYLTDEKVGLLSTSLEERGEDETGRGKAEGKQKPPARGSEQAQPDKEMPPNVPGAILRVDLDPDTVFAAGFPSGHVDVMVDSNRIFVPLEPGEGTNAGVYAAGKDLLRAGFMLEASRRQVPGAAYLMVQPHGRGKVIAFAEDPAYRGFTDGSMVLLADAVFLGPAF